MEIGAAVDIAAASMTTPQLRDLVTKAGDVLGMWGGAMPLSRELTPVLLSNDGKTLLDRAIYVEDNNGGYYVLKSGNLVYAHDGAVIGRPTLAQVMAQSGGNWRLEQMWSPVSRGHELKFHNDAPYLVEVVDGRAVVLDYGVCNADGELDGFGLFCKSGDNDNWVKRGMAA